MAPGCASCLSRHLVPSSGCSPFEFFNAVAFIAVILRKRSQTERGAEGSRLHGFCLCSELCLHAVTAPDSKSHRNFRHVQEDFDASEIILSLMLQLLSWYFRTSATFHEAYGLAKLVPPDGNGVSMLRCLPCEARDGQGLGFSFCGLELRALI